MDQSRVNAEISVLPSARGSFIAAGVCALLALAAWPFDHQLALVQNALLPATQDFWLEVEALAPTVLLSAVLLPGLWFWFFGRSQALRVSGVLLIAVPLIGISIADALKQFVARARPMHALNGLVEQGLSAPNPALDTKSFPSGHVVTAATAACVLWLLFHKRRWAWSFFLLMPLLVLDRTLLARHFTSDALASVALSCAVFGAALALLRHREVRPVGAWRGVALVAAVMAVGFAFARPVRVVDASSLAPFAGLSVQPQWTRLVLEPVTGPALALARFASPRELTAACGPLLLIAVIAFAMFPRKAAWQQRCKRALVLLLWIGAVGVCAWQGWAPADRFVATTPGVFFDGHVHAGDAVDGHADAETMLQRAAARGIDVVAITNHDALPPTVAVPAGLAVVQGLEWSGGAHARGDVTAHVLCYGESTALRVALSEHISREDVTAGLCAQRTVEAIAAVKRAGGVTIVAHDWRTRSALGTQSARVPEFAAYVSAGVDGFEIAQRALPESATEAEQVRMLAQRCADSRLLSCSNSDGHGRFTGAPCINFLPGEFPEAPAQRAEAVLQHLREHRRVRPLLVAAPQARVVGPQGGSPVPTVWMIWDYLRTLPGWGRASWVAWAVLLALLLRRTERRLPAG